MALNRPQRGQGTGGPSLQRWGRGINKSEFESPTFEKVGHPALDRNVITMSVP